MGTQNVIASPSPPREMALDRMAIIIHNHIVIEHMSYMMTPTEQLDATFMALSDPTRRAILARLAEGEASVNELAEPFTLSQPAVSRHIKVLADAGLIV